MESNYNNRDFEEFVKHNADQYRMFPSEKVWKGINNALHTRRRWYGIGLALLLLTSGTVTWVMLNPAPEADQNVVQPIAINSPAVTQADNEKIAIVPVAPVRQVTKPSNESFTIITGLSDQEKEYVFPFKASVTPSLIAKLDNDQQEIVSPLPQTINTVALPIEENDRSIRISVAQTANKLTNSLEPGIIDDNPEITKASTMNSEVPALERTQDIYPMSIESVVNSYKSAARKKLTLQVYFTPTVSYRKLRENKNYVRSAAFANNPSNLAALSDVNSEVTHKPDLGLEIGTSLGYQATAVMKFKAGIQFNLSRYDIKAYTANGEIATIALDNGSNVVGVSTNLRNKSGYKTNWLQNLYYSVSAPVGLEIKLGDNGKTSLNIGGTVQPTYILSERAYLISTDYKNYVEVPSWTRRWNISTSVESFVAYSTGKLNWQVGPQVRYQLLSSFQEKYPVRENIFDFGLKVGVMLNR